MLIDVAFPSLIITEQYSINYFQFLFYVSEKTGNKEFPKSKKLKNIISMKKCKNWQKNFFLLEPEPEKKIQNGSGSKGPKKPGSASQHWKNIWVGLYNNSI